MSFILFEICRGRSEELAIFEKCSRAVEVAIALCDHSQQAGLRLDYEVVGYDRTIHYSTMTVEHQRESLENIFDK